MNEELHINCKPLYIITAFVFGIVAVIGEIRVLDHTVGVDDLYLSFSMFVFGVVGLLALIIFTVDK